MRLSREEFREHLVDYLYGQLGAPQRESFEACLTESADCRQELAEFQQTLDNARSGLAFLEEAPPARARQALLALAAAPVNTQLKPPVSTPAWTRFSAWLSTPVSLGALSVAAVAALGLLVHQSQHDEVRNAQPESVEPTAPAREPSRTGAVQEHPGALGTVPETQPASSNGARPSAATPVPAPARDVADEPVTRKPSPAPARRATTPPRPPTRLAPAKEAASAAESRQGSGAARPAAPRSEAPQLEDESPASTPAPSPSRASRAREPSAASSSDMLDAAPTPPSALGATGAPKGLGADSRAAPAATLVTPETLEREASAQLAAHRLREAAQSYETLLRRFPHDARAPQWQKQLALVQRALRESAPAR